MKGENTQKWADWTVCGLGCFVFLEALVILVGEVAQAILAIRG